MSVAPTGVGFGGFNVPLSSCSVRNSGFGFSSIATVRSSGSFRRAPWRGSRTPRATSEAQIAPGRWDVDRVRCSDLLGAADDDRAAAAMFYYGYLAAKAGIHVIDVRQIDGNVRKVMDRCAAAPNITVPQAFRQALGRRG